jgi:hypothetical protein
MMLWFWRILSICILLTLAVVIGTLWAKAIGVVVGGGGLLLFVLAPLPVLGGLYVLGRWIDHRLAALARRKVRESRYYSKSYRQS